MYVCMYVCLHVCTVFADMCVSMHAFRSRLACLGEEKVRLKEEKEALALLLLAGLAGPEVNRASNGPPDVFK